MFGRYTSYLLALVGVLLIFARFEMLHFAKATPPIRAVPTAPNEETKPPSSSFQMSDEEKLAWRSLGGIPLTFDLDNPKGRTNESFSVSLSALRVDVKSKPVSTGTAQSLASLLDRLETQNCLWLKLDMPGMQFSPAEAVPFSSAGQIWNLWTDKKGTYTGMVSASLHCKTLAVPLIDPHTARFQTHVSEPLFDGESVKKAALEFLGPVLTLPVLLDWLKKLRAKLQKRNSPNDPATA